MFFWSKGFSHVFFSLSKAGLGVKEILWKYHFGYVCYSGLDHWQMVHSEALTAKESWRQGQRYSLDLDAAKPRMVTLTPPWSGSFPLAQAQCSRVYIGTESNQSISSAFPYYTQQQSTNQKRGSDSNFKIEHQKIGHRKVFTVLWPSHYYAAVCVWQGRVKHAVWACQHRGFGFSLTEHEKNHIVFYNREQRHGPKRSVLLHI